MLAKNLTTINRAAHDQVVPAATVVLAWAYLRRAGTAKRHNV
jgi:hypothetical protein